MDVQNKMREYITLINKANEEYYNDDSPAITDNEYDSLCRSLKALEEKYPQYKQVDSPTNRVGTKKLEKFEKSILKVPMMSLLDAFSYDELYDFDERVKKEFIDPTYVCELKIDGLSVSVDYENGLLVKASTRGNGEVGENITINAKTIKSIPLKIDVLENLTVRGEIYMSKKTLFKINKERNKDGLAPLLNVRNAAAGSVRQLDSKVVAKRNLETFMYNTPDNDDFDIKKHSDSLKFLKSLGFYVNDKMIVTKKMDKIINFINKIESIRDDLPYEIDGIVIKVNDLSMQKKLGVTSKYPKWAVAYKFPAKEVITRLKDIVFTVGRTGQITPNAVLTPTLLMGSMVQRATLHNEDYVISKDLKIGDYVSIRKAGDIIPEVIEPIISRRSNDVLDFIMIKKCPVCHESIKKIEGKVDYFCTNDNCPARKVECLIHFASKTAMNIEKMGPEVIEDFYNLGFLKCIEDFYSIYKYKDELINIDGYGKKSVTTIIENIEKSKNNSLERLLFSFGIPGIGKKKAYLLALEFVSLDKIISLKEEEISIIEDFGEVLAKNIVDFFKENKELIENIKKLGINTLYLGKEKLKNEEITNKKFVITGSFLKYSRDEIKDFLEMYSGKVQTSVSKKTDYLILGDEPGSKYDKALKLNICVIDEKKLYSIIDKITI